MVIAEQKHITLNNTTAQAMKLLLSDFQLKTIADHKITSDGNVQIIPRYYDDKVKIIEKLKSTSLKYFSYSEPSERQLIFVLK